MAFQIQDDNKYHRKQLAYRNKLAKEANRRMRELRKQNKDYGAGRKYDKFLKEVYGKKSRRKFFREYGKWDNNIAKEIHRLEWFLDYKTSTVAGIDSQRENQRNTMEKRYNLKFDNIEDYNKFIDFMTQNEAGKMLGSAQVIELYVSGEYTPDEIKTMFNQYKEKSPDNLDDVAKAMGFKTAQEMDERIFR